MMLTRSSAATTPPIMPDEITVSLEAGPPPGSSFRSGMWPVIYGGNEYWINAEVSTALPLNEQALMVAQAAARQIRVAKEIIRAPETPQAPVITSATTRTDRVGIPFSYRITARNSPTSFGATNLPSWASISGDTITGTPDTPVTGHVIGLEATNGVGTGNANLTLTILPAVPVVTNPGPQTWQVGVAITNIPVSATNSPTSYAATNLPTGVTINATSGLISGTPGTGTQGSRTVNLTATNAGGTSTPPVGMSVTIQPAAPAAPVITAGQTVPGTIGTAITNYTIAASGTPATFAIVTGTLPAGLSMSTAGVISGTPTPGTATAGAHVIGVTATNAGGTSPEVNVTINLAAQPVPVITSSTTPSAPELTTYTYQITASNGPTSYGATGLPGYLTGPDAQGRITGTLPAFPASATFDVTATNAAGTSTPVSVTLTVTEVNTSDLLMIGNNTARPTVGAEHGSLWITNNTDTFWAWVGIGGMDDWYPSTGSVLGP